MTISLDFYTDSGLTALAASVSAVQADDGSTGPVDRLLYLGSPVASKKFQASSNPGVAQIAINIADSNTGGGIPATAVKLALSSGGLNTATAGAPLNVGTEILSGSSNAIPVYVRIDAGTATAGTYNDLSLTTNSCVEVAA